MLGQLEIKQEYSKVGPTSLKFSLTNGCLCELHQMFWLEQIIFTFLL